MIKRKVLKAQKKASRGYTSIQGVCKWIFREIRRIYMADEIIYVMSTVVDGL